MQPSAPNDIPQPVAATPPAPADTPQPPAADVPALADDGDLIEKEWVVQVKQILSATAGDPFEQNKQLTRLKAEYMQKRYGKDIKVDS